MTVFITILLTVLSLAFIAYPFFRRRLMLAGTTENVKLQELESRRDTTYSMLKELEFDFYSGILTEEDYQELKEKYKQKAISILKDVDTLEQGTDVEEKIEEQIMQLRRSKDRFCPQCGTKHEENDRFCVQCGTSLQQGEKN